MNRSRGALFVALMSSVALIAGCGTSTNTSGSTPTGDQQLTSINIAQTSNSLGWAADDIAEKEGFFAKEGIKANILIQSSGDASTIPAVAGGGAQFGAATTLSTIQAISRGQNFKIIAPFNDEYVVQFIIAKKVAEKLGITSDMSMQEKMKKIKGLKIATLDVGGSLQLLFNGLAKQYGMDPNKDFIITAVHPYSSMLEALKRGQVDVGLAVIPYGSVAVNAGYAEMLANFWAGDVPGFSGAMHQSLFVNGDYATTHPAVVEAVRRAIGEALGFIHNHPNQTLKDLEEMFPKTSPAIIKEIVVTDGEGYPKDATVTKTGFDLVRNFVAQTANPAAANVKYNTAVWPSAQEK